MPLITGTPVGNTISSEDLFLEGAPYIYYQDYAASYLFNPDANSYYYNLSGTAAYPVRALGCYENVQLMGDITLNAVRCDKVGDKAVIQKLNHLAFEFRLSSLFPLTVLAPILRSSTPFEATAFEKMGIGKINNNAYYHVYLPKVYDELTGDFLSITIHRAQFAGAWTMTMPYGNKWLLEGVSAWGLIDESMPAGQEFATVIRVDPSALP